MNSRTARLLRRSGLPHATQRDLKRKWSTLRPAERAALVLELASLAAPQAVRARVAEPSLDRQQQMPPPPVQVGPVESVG